MKTKEELNALKEEVEIMSRKLRELTKEELEQVTGGFIPAEEGGKDSFARIPINWGPPLDA